MVNINEKAASICAQPVQQCVESEGGSPETKGLVAASAGRLQCGPSSPAVADIRDAKQAQRLCCAASSSVDELARNPELRQRLRSALAAYYGNDLADAPASGMRAGAEGVARGVRFVEREPAGLTPAPRRGVAPAASTEGGSASAAATATPRQVPAYRETFGTARWVPSSNTKVEGFAKEVVGRAPELRDSALAKELAAGKLSRDGVRALQRFLKSKGLAIGSTGADGKYGPKTHAAVRAFLATANGTAANGPSAPRTSSGGTPPTRRAPATAPPAAATTPATAPPGGAATPRRAGGVRAPGEASFRGDGIPPELTKAFDVARRSRYRRSGKCMQFAGTMAKAAGGTKTRNKSHIYPHAAYGPAITSHRGQDLGAGLRDAVSTGALKPGMLVHMKIHAERNTPYHTRDDGHHWVVYMGKDASGTPQFADNSGRQMSLDRTARRYHRVRSNKYGLQGQQRRITAFYDPFANRR